LDIFNLPISGQVIPELMHKVSMQCDMFFWGEMVFSRRRGRSRTAEADDGMINLGQLRPLFLGSGYNPEMDRQEAMAQSWERTARQHEETATRLSKPSGKADLDQQNRHFAESERLHAKMYRVFAKELREAARK
jgi:hypothetical protein